MSKHNELFEYQERHCPICGVFIKQEPPMHRCSEEVLKKIDLNNEKTNSKKVKKRTYFDKLDEFDKYYNADSYYDKDLEEE